MIIQSPYASVLTLSGPDTITLLERLVTCRVDNLTAGENLPGALLTPQGKIIADFHLTRTNDGCTLQVHADAAADLEKRLKMFRLRSDVKISSEAISPPSLDDQARIESGLSVYGADFAGSDVFPTDINLDVRGGVDYKKGCFVGQEVVSRMMRRGKIRKRTLILRGEGLTKGDPVLAGERRLGFITSATDISALAILRIDHLSQALIDKAELSSNGAPLEPALPDWVKAEMEALQNADT